MAELYVSIWNSKTPLVKFNIETDQADDIDVGFSYDTVQVFRGDKWIFYDKKKFAPNEGNSFVIKKGKPTKTTATILSARIVPHEQHAIILYEHVNYCGHQKLYQEIYLDINSDFPHDTRPGASSAMTWPSKTWRLFFKTGCPDTGAYTDLNPGTETPSFVPIGSNDKIQSLKPL